MTSDTPAPNDSNDDHLNISKDHEIERLEELVQGLQEEVSSLISERDRMTIESKLAIEDAELARSFSKKNYSGLLLELFEAPAKRLRKQNIALFLLSIITILALLISHVFTGLTSAPDSQLIESQLIELDRKIDLLSKKSISSTQEEEMSVAQHSLDQETPEKPNLANKVNSNQLADSIDGHAEEKNTPKIAPIESARDITIRQQADTILSYIQSAEQQNGFPTDYATNKTSFAQLYLIIMQHASNENIFYESYLKVINNLATEEGIAPKSIDGLIAIDLDFLQAAYSAYIITSKKLAKGWRYRDIDRKFSSYYNNNLDYNLGAWQIVNKSGDYKQLPEIFSLNIKRIVQQLQFNSKESLIKPPTEIYYKAYDQNSKNKAVTKLLNKAPTTNYRGVLAIDITKTDLQINTNALMNIQQ